MVMLWLLVVTVFMMVVPFLKFDEDGAALKLTSECESDIMGTWDSPPLKFRMGRN